MNRCRKSRFLQVILFFFVITGLSSCDFWTNHSGKFERIAEDYEPTPITFCFDCVSVNDVKEFEETLQSKPLNLGYYQSQRLGKNSFRPYPPYLYRKVDSLRTDYYVIYERSKSDIAGFNQLAVYLFHWHDTIIYTNHMRFYLGSNPFGYTPNRADGVLPENSKLDRSRPITLEALQKAYYSVISWLYSEKGKEYNLYVESERGIYDNYEIGRRQESDDFEFEHPWLKEFFFDWYRLESKFDEFDWKYSLHGVTYAPMRAYTSKDENGYLNPYELKLEDMAIRVDYYNRNLPPY